MFLAWTCSFNKQDFYRKINKDEGESLIRAFASILFHLKEGFSLQGNCCAALMGDWEACKLGIKKVDIGSNYTLLEENFSSI